MDEKIAGMGLLDSGGAGNLQGVVAKM